ncbi:hypothetical protein J7E63_26965 [Bacillus sp. ISL-75]|uniref:hypothetical protein n=1 Tax=Bacillus sp. ISL-75 TaxID=2819137 RepID=UPI001BECA873|nr:hypothetical protein [Bacillus sp. ISL-75]MBT2730472.1 hypothetical protein [Bacillus sp. ISL-75]
MFKNNKKVVFSLGMLFIPWLTVPFLGKKSFFRFLPVASFTNLFISMFSVIANKRKWWINKNPISPGLVDFTYILGPFFVATLWIFKLTYGNFLKFFVTNAVLDVICAYPFAEIWERVGVFKLKKLSHTMWYVFCISLAVIIYGFQKLVEKSIRETKGPESKL